MNRHTDIHIGMGNGGPQRERSRCPYTKGILHNQPFSPQKSCGGR
jgi:hypothetical protein